MQSGMTDVSCGAAEFDPGAALGGIEEETDGELTHEAVITKLDFLFGDYQV